MVENKNYDFQSVSEYVYHYARTKPDQDIMVLGDNRISYKDLAGKVDACAKALLAIDVQKGDRVATLCTPSPDFFVLFLATASIGAIWVGLNPKYTLDELSYVVTDAKPKVIFSRTQIGQRDYTADLVSLKEACGTTDSIIALDTVDEPFQGITYDTFLAQSETKISEADLRKRQVSVGGREPALIVYTSGTTGKPKGALLPHCGLISCCELQNKIYACDHMSIINFLPINHIGCVGDISCMTLIAGGTIFFMEKFDPEESLRMMSEENITVWGGVPTTLQMSLNHPNFDQYDLSNLELIMWSGAAAPKELVEGLAKVHPRLGNCYGQTETVGSITFVPPCSDIDLLTNTVGIPPKEYDVRIVDQEGRVVADGESGEIVVRGDFLMTEYWERPEATASTIDADGWLHTGDLGSRRPDGYIRLISRIKEVFKSGGYNVYPREIEQVLEAYPGVAMSAVIPVPDSLFGEVGCAFILAPSGGVDADELKAYCQEHLANYKIPKTFNVQPELPMLPIGKIDKQTLKKSVLEQGSTA